MVVLQPSIKEYSMPKPLVFLETSGWGFLKTQGGGSRNLSIEVADSLGVVVLES